MTKFKHEKTRQICSKGKESVQDAHCLKNNVIVDKKKQLEIYDKLEIYHMVII